MKLLPCVVNLFAQDIDRINDTDYDRIHGRIFQVWRQSRGTALAKHDQLPNARAHAINSDYRVGTRSELCRVFVIH
jgi:hypothetical protein